MAGPRARLAPAAAVELGLLAAAVVLAWIAVPTAAGRWLERVAALSLASSPDSDAVRADARLACVLFSAGVAALAAGRALGLRRSRDLLATPVLLPAAAGAALLGLVLHTATVETGFRTVAGARQQVVTLASGSEFAQGFLLGCLAGALVLALALDPADLVRRVQPLLVVGCAAVFAALAAFGTGPGDSGTRINLGPAQPIEAVKLGVVAFLAGYLGARAAKLRWQRGRVLGLRWPRPKLLIPALAALIASFAGMYLVGDLGPTLILALVFLGMFYLATRASGWVLAGLALLALALIVLAIWPAAAGSGHVATRLAMWQDPWRNGLSHGHQIGEGLWAISAGGFSGQGLAQASTPLPPAGMTDLVLALLVEQIGFAGLFLYLGLIAAVVLSGLHVAARNRTPERVLLAAGVSLLLFIQWGIIYAGTLGLLPLTGVIVPFLSSGRSSMIVFVVAVAVIARLGEDARERARSVELDELRRGVLPLAIVSAFLLVGALVAGLRVSVVSNEDIATSGIVVRLRDGTVVHRHNPRLLALAAAIRRGAIEDRDGRPLAHNPDPAQPTRREYPLGPGLGTLVGAHPTRVQLPAWALEARHDHRLRGYPERPDAPRYADFAAGHGDARLPSPDLRPLAPLLYLSPPARRQRLAALDAAVAGRSVRLSIDARLQAEVAGTLAQHIAGGKAPAAAAVVIDVATGQVLARAQVPDLDPSDTSWQERLARNDAELAGRFWGAYGPGSDKTGLLGVFQAGSVAKLLTALAAARAGWSHAGVGCELSTDIRFGCRQRDADGPLFALDGWRRPIHDFYKDHPHGEVDLVQALAVSCNVYFAQLGLALGPEPFRALAGAGIEIGYRNDRIRFQPGDPGSRQLASTAFGQGAMAMSVMQAARLVAAIGAAGVYRSCPPSLELAAACEERRIIDDPAALSPILAGMHRVMTDGTGARLERVPAVRIYGKTGTADTPRFRSEELYGVADRDPPPHSWFVALVEPAAAPECAPAASGRLALAVVVPRGGIGSQRAGPIAIDIVKSLVRHGYLPSGDGADR